MPKLTALTFSIFFLLTFGVSAQNKDKGPVNAGKVKLLKTSDFKHTDVGSPAVAGTVSNVSKGFDITAGGADIWGVKDEFNFIYTELTGDFDIIARVESFVAPHLYGKAGLMAREELTPGSRHIYFQMFQDNKPRNKNNGGFEYQYRQVAGGEMKAIYPAKAEGAPEFPVTFPDTWIRLKRTGNNFTGFTGTDGKSWKEYATYTLELPAKLFVGPAVTSHKATEAATAKFRNLGLIK